MTCAVVCDPESHLQPESEVEESTSVVKYFLSGSCSPNHQNLMSTNVLERLVLAHLRPQGDPLQLTNQHNLGVDDVIIYILERLHFRRY